MYGQFVHNRKTGRTPGDAIYVGRPSEWGNPVKVSEAFPRGAAVREYARLVLQGADCVPSVERIRAELRGRHLECWCAPEMCHAHVLACIANEPDGVERVMRMLESSLANGVAR